MSANFDTGFSVREVPWHGLGNVLADYPENWAAARTLAGLDWDPIEVPVFEIEALGGGETAVLPIEDFKQIKRSDTNKRLAIVSQGYEMITHDVFGEIFEAIQDSSDGDVKYETAGSLEDGKKVWVLSRLGDAVRLPGDPSEIQPYMALMTSHDGTAALKVIMTSVRIVCMNTWHAADVEASRRGSSYSFKHTKNWRNNVEQCKKALSNARDDFESVMSTAREMLEVQVNAKQVNWFIEKFAVERTLSTTVGKQRFTKAQVAERMTHPRVKASLDNTLSVLHKIMESETTAGIRGTMYGLVQAAGEFSDHFRATANAESYFNRTVLADKEPLKNLGIRVAELALAQ